MLSRISPPLIVFVFLIFILIFRLTELTRNKCFTAAVAKVPQHRRCNVIQTLFPALTALGEVFTQQYPMFHVDLSDSNKHFITDILTDEGLAISDDSSSSMDDVSWVILRVTHVSGPQQLWAEFSIDKKMEEHRDIFKYHEAVSNKYGSMIDVLFH